MPKTAKNTWEFKGKKAVYYDRLLKIRDTVMGQMQSHAESALNCSEAEKRGVTTHMADVCSDNSRHEMELRLMTEEGNVLELIEQAIQRLADGKYGFSTAGKIVVIEGVGNTSKYVAKSLDTLLEKGFFKGAAAVIFGHFSRPFDREQIDAALEKFAGKVDIPVYRNFPFGHQADNLVIDFTRHAFIKNNMITFPEVKK